MTILISGATGLVGKEIVRQCHERDINVHYLTSSKSKLSTEPNYKGFYWNIEDGQIDLSCFEGVSVIIHLAGASISKRWTDSYKKEVLESRVNSTRLLREGIQQSKANIEHVISASAIGIYPSSETDYYKEDVNEVSSTFLGDVVQQWEAAVDTFLGDGLRVSKLRIGLVLSANGGALPEIIRPVKFGLGAAFGSGEQWQSWIHIEDLASAFLFVMDQELEGVFNAVAPNPVTNKELTKMSARILKRPIVLPNIPRFAMQLILGEMSMLLFESQRVSSAKLEGEGFLFKYANLKPALNNLLF